MDLTTTIIGISLFLISVVPVLVLIRSGNKKSKKIKEAFDNLAIKHEVQLTEQETWNDNIIGIDAVNKKVLYASHQAPEGIFVDLNQIATCKVIRETQDNLTVVQGEKAARMGILFKYKNNGQDISMSFYDIDFDDPLQMSYNSKRVSKWRDLISESLY